MIDNPTMTILMKKAIEELAKLPEKEQDAWALKILDELRNASGETDMPLQELVGAGAGLYESESPEEIDRVIRNERDRWES